MTEWCQPHQFSFLKGVKVSQTSQQRLPPISKSGWPLAESEAGKLGHSTILRLSYIGNHPLLETKHVVALRTLELSSKDEMDIKKAVKWVFHCNTGPRGKNGLGDKVLCNIPFLFSHGIIGHFIEKISISFHLMIWNSPGLFIITVVFVIIIVILEMME